ncbi:hypothetical protein N9B82_04680 [Saprospiraceae bacterium]|nr:hypothetical protein [Saprospiraceae bacterium]
MRSFVGLFFLLISFSSCENKPYSGLCEQSILESSSDFDNGPFDPTTTINSVSWNGECLDISYTYSGGCEEHELSVITNGAIIKTDPPIAELIIKHNNTDQCEALITEVISYDLGENYFLNDEDVIILKFVNPEFSFTLEK